MRRLTLGGMLAVLALFPAGTLAGTPRATMLSVDRQHRALALIGADRLVHAFRYRGALPRLGVGDRVSFRRSGHAISHVTRTARASGTVSFNAQVVRSGSGALRLRLADGAPLNLAAPLTRQIHGLTPGATVLIHETPHSGRRWTVTIPPPPSTTSSATVASGGDPPADDEVAEGTITQVSGTALTVSRGTRSLRFAVGPSSGLTDGFAVGDLVDVSYAQNADGSLSADAMDYVEQDASGQVAAVSDGRITLAGQAGGEPLTIAADHGLFDGILAGDAVDVAYHQSAAGPVADSVDDRSWAAGDSVWSRR
ncbi:MAG TPA: DUF5666 domain-containing protein [Solirubrobacteraceae bacterium]|nr:DUF5666 domain-containing protein [Solirubrobacteraceae bacterium]